MNYWLFIGILVLAIIIINVFSWCAKTGFGKGKVEIILDKTHFNFGEKITGKVRIHAKKPFIAEIQTIGLKAESKKSNKNINSTNYSYNNEIPILEKNNEYFSGEIKEYNFEINTPEGLIPISSNQTINKTINFAVGITTNIRWNVTTRIKITNFVSISNFKKITLK